MKYLKMLGLTVVAAAAVMAFAGAGTASATVLCKTNTAPCSEMYSTGQEMAAEGETGNLILKAGFAVVECKHGTVKGTQSNTGSASETVNYGLSETGVVVETQNQKEGLTFSECTGAVTVEKAGKLILHWISGTTNATVTSEGAKVKVVQAGVTCIYGTSEAGVTDVGTLTGSNVTGGTPTMDVSAELKKEAGSSFLCASPAHWEGSYKVTTPMEGYAAES